FALQRCTYFFYRSPAPVHLHSFPTRRSSDLGRPRARALLVGGHQRGDRGAHHGRDDEAGVANRHHGAAHDRQPPAVAGLGRDRRDRKSTRLNSSHLVISYAVFCLKKKKKHSNARYYNHTQLIASSNTALRCESQRHTHYHSSST